MSMRDRIQTALQPLDPQHVEVLDESHMHSRGLETHFRWCWSARSSPG